MEQPEGTIKRRNAWGIAFVDILKTQALEAEPSWTPLQALATPEAEPSWKSWGSQALEAEPSSTPWQACMDPIWGQHEPTWASLRSSWRQLGANLGQR